MQHSAGVVRLQDAHDGLRDLRPLLERRGWGGPGLGTRRALKFTGRRNRARAAEYEGRSRWPRRSSGAPKTALAAGNGSGLQGVDREQVTVATVTTVSEVLDAWHE